MIKTVLLLSILLSFSGCTREEEAIESNELVLNEKVVILKGQKIVPLSDDAQVKILKNSAQSTISVTLIQGSAKVE